MGRAITSKMSDSVFVPDTCVTAFWSDGASSIKAGSTARGGKMVIGSSQLGCRRGLPLDLVVLQDRKRPTPPAAHALRGEAVAPDQRIDSPMVGTALRAWCSERTREGSGTRRLDIRSRCSLTHKTLRRRSTVSQWRSVWARGVKAFDHLPVRISRMYSSDVGTVRQPFPSHADGSDRERPTRTWNGRNGASEKQNG